MRPALAVLRRELAIAFTTPLAWAALAAFSLVTALLFWLELLSFEQAQQRAMALNDPALLSLLDFNDLLLGGVLLHAQVLLVFVVPLLTMRTFAGEDSLDALLAAPVSTGSVVLGKLGAVVVELVLATLTLLVYPVLLAIFGRAVVAGDGVVDWAQVCVGLGAVVAVGTLYTSLGCAISAATSSLSAQGGSSTAALVTAVALVALWLAGSAAPGIEGAGGAVLSWLAPSSHLERLARGIVALPDVVYFVSTTLALGFITHRLVDARRAPA